MPEQLAITIAGIAAPFLVEAAKWLEKQISGSVIEGKAALIVSFLFSGILAAAILIWTGTSFNLLDFFYKGTTAFGLATIVFNILKANNLRVEKPA